MRSAHEPAAERTRALPIRPTAGSGGESGGGGRRAGACAVAARGGGWARAALRGRDGVTSLAALLPSERPRSGRRRAGHSPASG